jgi:hypothetical protein
MLDNRAFTVPVLLDNGFDLCFEAKVKPGTDYDSEFLCYDEDNKEFLRVKGWLFIVEAL